jgi:hypothetical protein
MAQVYIRTSDGRDVPIEEHRTRPKPADPDADLTERLRGTVVNGTRRYPSQGELRAIEMERMQRSEDREVSRLAREGRQASEIIDAIEDDGSEGAES